MFKPESLVVKYSEVWTEIKFVDIIMFTVYMFILYCGDCRGWAAEVKY